MSTKFFLLSLGGVAVTALGALGLVLTMVNPFRATTLQLLFFYSALFFVLSALFAAAAFFVLRYLGLSKERVQSVALREGVIVGGLVVTVLLLQSQKLLTLPVMIAIVALVVVTEFYAVSALQLDSSGKRSALALNETYEEK